jgi:hypothetical protein
VGGFEFSLFRPHRYIIAAALRSSVFPQYPSGGIDAYREASIESAAP